MTTGRINQVTIFYAPGHRARELTPERAELYTERRFPAAGCTLERGYTGFTHYPIAPTEFPTGRSATQVIQRQAPSHSATYTPQEEDTVHPSRPEAATGLGLPPNVFGLGLTIGQ
jgi:hypothetical protein